MRVLEKRVRELERLLGRKTSENEILKEALALARPKKANIAARLVGCAKGRFPMKAVAETLGVARSDLIERRAGVTKPRGRYRKDEEAAIQPLIRDIVDKRPTFGYR